MEKPGNRWFKVQPNDALVGDAPMATLKKAVDEVIKQYEEAHKRRPSHADWQALLTIAMDRLEIGVVKTVTIDLAHDDGADDDFDDSPVPPKKTSGLH